MPIYFQSIDVNDPLKKNKRKIKKWITHTITTHNRSVGEISFVFCSNKYIKEINRKFLNHDYFTDVITFSYNKDLEISGDILISIEQVKINATDYKVDFFEELLRVMIHGILHLLNYDDKDEAESKLMRDAENKALSYYQSTDFDNTLKL